MPAQVLDRVTFNKLAVRLDLPVYWVADGNQSGTPDPDEVASLLFYPTAAKLVENGAFTAAFEDAKKKIATEQTAPTLRDERQKLVVSELDEATPTLVKNDFRKLSPEERAFVARMLEVGAAIDDLYAKQTGQKALAAKLPAGDLASQSLFRRSWGPKCDTPKLEKNKACSALPGGAERPVDVYPEALQKDGKFCEALEKQKDAKALLTPFTAVREKDGKLSAVPYTEAYKAEMEAVAKHLDDAAKAAPGATEKPLQQYLTAAAKAFRTNDWNPADEAWAKMTAENSKWYVRVGPDETYWEPCSQKAGFHMTFARINQGSLAWQGKLRPVQQEMEDTLAKLLGAPYASRKVTFHLPDFIDIVTNHGDDRAPIGATIGQSLPNWGPVVKAGRGRTVAMSNLYTDTDSEAVRKAKASSLLDKDAMGGYPADAQAGLFATILHEATHNLGPAHEYKFQGKTDAQAFGGDLASMMEELKAQTGGLYYIDFAQKKGIVTAELAKQTYVDSIVWALNHIGQGMYTETGKRKPYNVLSAIQIGILLDEGALTFAADGAAANGSDKGAFTVHFDKLPAAIEKMMKTVGGLKANADRGAAEALAKKYADGPAVPHELIQQRVLRFPQTSFVYAVDL